MRGGARRKDYSTLAAEVSLKYSAYQSRNDGTDFSSEGRDAAVGIRGRHIHNGATPIATADTLQELQHEARAYLGKVPEASLYLTDADDWIHDTMINEKYHEATGNAAVRTAICIALLMFCMTALIGAALGFPARWALLSFIAATALYAAILKAKMYNEIEGAVICEMLLILISVMISTVR